MSDVNDKGWVYAYRKAWTHPAFNNLREAAIWNFLYQNAFWEDGDRNFNGYTFQLKRGQIVVSISFLAKGFGMTEKGVRVVIQKLEKLGMVVKQGASKGTIITICNYDDFQVKEKTKGEQSGKRGANEGQTKGDNNNESTKGNEGKERKDSRDILIVPDFIDGDIWLSFVAHRGGSKFTKRAAKLTLNELTTWHDKGHNVNDILNRSIMNGWKGVFEPETKKGNKNGRQKLADEAAELLEQYADTGTG